METNSSDQNSSENPASVLFDLSKLDTEIAIIFQKLKDLEDKKNSAQKEIQTLKVNFDKLAAVHLSAAKNLLVEEERIETENKRIIERRKQLTSLGGTKSAKLTEREVDIAARTLQIMEQKVLQMMEDVEKHKAAEEKVKATLDQKQQDFEGTKVENETLVADFIKRQSELKLRRDEFLLKLDVSMKALYSKLATRYPAGAIAQVVSGSCRTCFTSIPPQIFNQVLSGQLHQCPSCSRILIIVND